MRKTLSVLLLAVFPLLAISLSAEAARLGGGRSFGRSFNAPAKPAPAVTRPASPQNAAPAPARPAWQGLLGGALLGLGLGALFSSLGLSGAMGSLLSALLFGALVVFAVSFAMRWWARRQMPASAGAPMARQQASHPMRDPMGATNGRSAAPEIGSGLGSAAVSESIQESEWEIPADFDQVAFLRQAKTQFIRLQAAWDKADLNDLRQFTTAEMFAEIKVDLQDRGSSENVTEVMTVEGQLLGILTNVDEYVASIRMSGTIKEGKDVPTTGFSEIWYWTKAKQGGGWLLAGIEQR